MKKLLIYILILAVVTALVVFLVPRRIDLSLDGVRYHSDKNMHQFEKVGIELVGSYKRGYIFPSKFYGFLTFDTVCENLEVELEFDRFNKAIIRNTYYDNNLGDFRSDFYGTVFINKNFNTVLVLLSDEVVDNSNEGLGNRISAPTSSLEEARKMSSDIFKVD